MICPITLLNAKDNIIHIIIFITADNHCAKKGDSRGKDVPQVRKES